MSLLLDIIMYHERMWSLSFEFVRFDILELVSFSMCLMKFDVCSFAVDFVEILWIFLEV